MTIKWRAVIRETECIGCTKCIEVCPVDAILGSQQLMHTVINQECVGCKLCLPPCPIDCIDLISLTESEERISKEHIQRRYQARKERLQKQTELLVTNNEKTLSQKQQYIKAAFLRTKNKKYLR